MDRLNRALAKAGQIAQQFNDDVQRAREQQQQQQQQQQQAQYQLRNHRLTQQYTQQYHQYQHPHQYQPTTHERPPPQPPRPNNQPSSPPPRPVLPQTSSGDYISKAEADLERLKEQQREQLRLAEAEIARLRAEQDKQQREAEREAHAARVEAEKLAAEEMRRLQVERDDAEERAKREVEVMQREAEGLAVVELGRLQAQQEEDGRNAAALTTSVRNEVERSSSDEAGRLKTEKEEEEDEKEAERLVRQLEEDRKAAEKLAAEFDAELREAEVDMERIKLSKEEPSRPPLPPRISQQHRAPTLTTQPSTHSATTPPTTAPPPASPSQSNQQTATPRYLTPLPPLSPHPPQKHISGITPLKHCPGSAPLDISLEYLTHDASPNFTICTRCYVDHIFPSPFKNSFHLITTNFPSHHQPRGCYFSVDRVKEHLWPEAVATKSLRGVLEYMIKRPGIAACSKTEEVKGRVWYQSEDCKGLAICEACFEERMVGGGFEKNFEARRVGGGATCDMATMFIMRILEKFGELNDWASFCKEAYTRIRLAPCPKTKTISGSSWFYPKAGPQGLKLCIACFCDFFIDTPSEAEFFRNDEGSAFSCSMGLGRISMLTQEATRRKDHDIWWEKIHLIAENAPCDPSGTTSEKWYTLPSKPQGFAICGGCIAGIVDPLSASSYFIPANTIPPTHPFLCGFNESHPRVSTHLLLFLQTILTGDTTTLSTFTHKLSHVPPCPRLNSSSAGNHKTWYGWPDCPICEECYLTFASPLHPSPPFELDGKYSNPHPSMCDLYSPRMRTLYKTACQTGSFTTFLTLARERREVYLDAYLPVQNYLQEIKLAALQAQSLGVQGTVYKSMGRTVDVTMGHSYTLGNATLGYGFENEFMLQGAVYDREAEGMRARVMDPVRRARMEALNERWLAVE